MDDVTLVRDFFIALGLPLQILSFAIHVVCLPLIVGALFLIARRMK